MKRLVLALVVATCAACGTDECRPGYVMGEPGHCVVPDKGGGAGMSSQGHPTGTIDEGDAGKAAGAAGKIAAGSGGKASGVAGSHVATGGNPAESAGSGGKPEVDAGTHLDEGGKGGTEAGSGGAAAGSSGNAEPPDAGADSGPPAPRCGDNRKDPGEECDGDCPTDCDDGDPCTTDKLTGDALTCDAKCSHAPVTAAKGGDGCCPSNANSGNDSDCKPSCGNGVVDSGEICDGNCRTSCDGGEACAPLVLTGSPTMCNVTCVAKPITKPKNGDQCCPDGANAANDSDCKAVCGNGVKEGNEICDGADCPTDCQASGCTQVVASGSAATCDAVCKKTTITSKVDGDGCCPANADFNTDNDCAPPAGCTAPSSGNMIRNPGFATGLSGWDVGNSSYGTVGWSSGDYESCPVSGSALFTVNNKDGKQITQCIPVSGGGRYYFSARIKSGGNGGMTTCAVAAYQLAGCTGAGKGEAEVDWVNVDWGPNTSYSFDVDTSFQSLLVACWLNALGVEADATAEVDQLYLGRTDAAF